METYLPIIKATLSDWILLTINNPYYDLVIVAVVFCLTAFLYSFRIGSLNKEIIASENARIEIQNNLNKAQQQMQLIQEELATNNGQMQKDRQAAQKEAERAAKFEELLSQRNKQVAGIIQSLHTSFDLGERPVPLMGDIKAEGLWQQHDRVVNLLTTRLQSEQQAKTQLQLSYQAETEKRAEKEVLIEILQTTLAARTSQVSKLEQASEEQKSLLQQQQDKAQLVLSQTLEKHLTELARLAELEKQSLELVNTKQQLTQLEEMLNAKNARITQLEKDKSDDQVKVQAQPALLQQEKIETIIEVQMTDEEVPPAPSDIKQQPVKTVKVQTGGVGEKIRNLFEKAKQEIMTGEPMAAEIKKDEAEIQPAPLVVEQPPVIAGKEHTGGVAGKVRNLFSKAKQEIMTGETTVAEETMDEVETQPAPSVEEQSLVSADKSQFGKIKKLFGSKQQPEESHQEEAQTEPSVEEQMPVSAAKGRFGKFKNLFGSKQQALDNHQEEEVQFSPSAEEQTSLSAAKSKFRKLKNIFGSKQQPEEAPQEEAQPAPSVEEPQLVSAAKSQFGMLKNMFASKQHPDETEQEKVQTEPVAEEQPPVSAAKAQFGKLKNLFGKTK